MVKTLLFTFSLLLHISASEKPNVLFIAVDDLNDWVGHLKGHPNAMTPNLDRLARHGVSFTRAYCPSPLCNPSRISLLSGVAPHKSGVYSNKDKLRDKMPNAVTLMQHFIMSGYSVKGGGKIFHSPRAYDHASWNSFNHPQKKQLTLKKRTPKSVWAPWGAVTNPDKDMFDTMNTNWLISELKQNHSKPFFLACGFTKPHLPWKVPQKYFDLHPLKKIKLPPTLKGDLKDVPSYAKKLAAGKGYAFEGGDHNNVIANKQWHKGVQAYLAAISFVDDKLGRILDALEKSQYAKNTIIVLWGDHGWHLGEKEHWRKQTLWEVATRTTFIISTPETVKGQLCNSPVSLLDIYPTLIDLCKLPKRDNLDGLSLKPLLQEPESKTNRSILMTYGKDNHAVQNERYRYIRYHDGSEELYDHKKDPNEWHNLAKNPEYSKIISQLQKSLPK